MVNLKELRTQKKITQLKLAELLGVTQAAVSQWESGTANPDLLYVKRLTEILSCTADELLGIGQPEREVS